MIDPIALQLVEAAKAQIERLTPTLLQISQSAEQVHSFIREIEAISARIASPFDKMVLEDRTWAFVQNLQSQLLAGLEQDENDHLLVSSTLPRRGWYLNGHEPYTLTKALAKHVRNEQWDQVDRQVMEHLPEFHMDKLQVWLEEENVPNHCINRLNRFIKHHEDGNYEEATYLGVPLLDEIAKHLYCGKTFTTKRSNRRGGDQSKPELAFKTANGPDLGNYCESFVQAFGSLQEDPRQDSLADENYWNRHAIVHGLMQRPMGVKDSAKCLMAINFLLFAREDERDEDKIIESVA